MGLAAGTSTKVQQHRRASRTECRVAGVTLPLNKKFDPLNLASTDAKMDRYTAVEIKHGRISMIAVMGYILPEFFQFPGCEGFSTGLGALSSIPVEGWIQMVALVGAHEALVKPRAGGMGPADVGLGTWLLDGIAEEELERRQSVERNNGRLAMVAIMGLMVQDGLLGQSPFAAAKTMGMWGPSVNWLIADIPVCNVGGCALHKERRGPGLTAMRATATGEATPEVKMSAAIPYLQHPKTLDGYVGSEKGFDPLGVTDALPTYLVREAELKHARVCMLATVGWMATDLGMRFPSDQFQGLSTLEAHDKMVSAGVMGPMLGVIGCGELFSGWLLFEGWFGGVNRDSGDFFFGKQFLPKDEAKANEMRLKELENGRLAMLAFSGIVTQAALTKSTWPFL
jgi:hypothetical protein